MVPITDHPVVAMVQEDHLVDMDHLAVMGKGLLGEVMDQGDHHHVGLGRVEEMDIALAMDPLGVVMVDLEEDATLGTDHVEEGVEDKAPRDRVGVTLEGVDLLVEATDHLEVITVHPTMVDMAQVAGAGGLGVEVAVHLVDGMARGRLVVIMEAQTRGLLVATVMVCILIILGGILTDGSFNLTIF